MTKEEKIKEAWGEYYEDYKERVDENGWFNWFDRCWEKMKQRQRLLVENPDIFDKDKYSYRPKELRGIGNNNGWIKIENEEDLPLIDYDDLFVFIDNKVELFSEVSRLRNEESGYFEEDITYYQPLMKPKPPLY